jgi:hypothetical protein
MFSHLFVSTAAIIKKASIEVHSVKLVLLQRILFLRSGKFHPRMLGRCSHLSFTRKKALTEVHSVKLVLLPRMLFLRSGKATSETMEKTPSPKRRGVQSACYYFAAFAAAMAAS